MSNKLITSFCSVLFGFVRFCSVLLAVAASSAAAGNFTQTNPNSQLKSVLDSVQKSAMTFSPEVIEAENYSSQSGIRLGNTEDFGATRFVGWIDNNDFTEYSVTVPESGTYELQARVASARNNATVGVSSNGSAAGSFSVAPTGGWEAWQTVSTSVNLPAGTQTIRLQYSGSGAGLMNINWFSLSIGDGEDGGEGGPQTGDDRELDSSLWTLAANLNTADAYLAIDNDNGSRWTTREVQRSGQEFSIKLNSTESFDRVFLDSSRSNGDQPRRYEVAVSNDGVQWSTVATGTGDGNGLTVIDFADQSASFVRMRQLGSATRNWWSIHEVKLFANSSDPIPPVETPVGHQTAGLMI